MFVVNSANHSLTLLNNVTDANPSNSNYSVFWCLSDHGVAHQNCFHLNVKRGLTPLVALGRLILHHRSSRMQVESLLRSLSVLGIHQVSFNSVVRVVPFDWRLVDDAASSTL